jgi:hypothetical protein
MQFTKIRLNGRYNVDFPFFGLRPSSRYILKEVDGLGPPEVDVRLEDGHYIGREPVSREIVLRAGLNPNVAIGETAASMRIALYGLLTPGASDAMLVQMMNGPNVVAQVLAYVKKIEPVIFSKDPEVQITMACNSPYLAAPVGTTVQPRNLTAANTGWTLNNTGTVSTGFYMELKYTSDRDSFSLYSEPADSGNGPDVNGPRFRVDWPFKDGDTLKIDTRKNRKSVRVVHRGDTTNIIRGLTPDSIWFQFHPGLNTFWNEPITFDWNQVYYVPQYWGI